MSSLPILDDIDSFRTRLAGARAAGLRVGLVPTMGALHAGHLALVAEARRRSQFVAVSIFVNPTQFGPHEDFAKYPRKLAEDVAALAEAGADVVFAPRDPSVMYPPGDETRVTPGTAARLFEGEVRPGHFVGVATVCLKLFLLGGPGVAIFGRKDVQQLAVVRRMVRDFFVPVEIVAHPIVRDVDGLALSSRNAYLTPDVRLRARIIPASLSEAVRAYAGGERRVAALLNAARSGLDKQADSVDYVSLVDADTVVPLAPDAQVSGGEVLVLAARFGGVRLLDNVVLGEDVPPDEVFLR